MVTAGHGRPIDLAFLRRRYGGTERGHSLREVAAVAADLGFATRPLRVDLSALHRLACPCLLHWDLNHFVVLKSATRRRAVIHDPARGVLKLKPAELSQHFTGVALELSPRQAFRYQAPAQRLRLSDLWSGMRGLKRAMALTLLLSLLLQLFVLATPFYLQTVIDDVAPRGDRDLMVVLALGFAMLLVLEVATTALRSSVLLSLSTRLQLQLSSNLMHHLLHLPLPWFRRRHLGDVISRFGSMEAVRDILSEGLVTAVVDGLMAVLMLIVMMLYSRQLTLVVLFALLLYLAFQVALFQPVRRASLESVQEHARCDSSLMESARAIQTIKLAQGEQHRLSHWHNHMVRAMNSDIRVARLNVLSAAVNGFVFGAENLLVIFLAADMVMANTLSIGMLVAFISYKQRFITSTNGLMAQAFELRMLGLHLERLSDIALAAVEHSPAQGVGLAKSDSKNLQIEAKRLGYRHGTEGPWLFRELSFCIPPGSCCAIIGPSGSGKTTLLHCLMGLYSPAEGEVRVDGHAVDNCPDYRRCLAAVTQEDQLLSGSILDNILGFQPQLDWERLIHCAKLACIDDDIQRLPMRYETPVGDMGAALSGGQVQRIMLARALYRQPALLLLDEATSHLDIATEQRINQNLARLAITRVLVAHRPETIAVADTTICLGADGPNAVAVAGVREEANGNNR
jgi:ATP-binding cassette subfamily B protein RaxB